MLDKMFVSGIHKKPLPNQLYDIESIFLIGQKSELHQEGIWMANKPWKDVQHSYSLYACMQSHVWLFTTRLLCSWNFPGKNTEVGCHLLLQGIFPTQGLNLCVLWPLHWQGDSLPRVTWDILLVIKEIQIKTTTRYKYISIRITKFLKKIKNPSDGENGTQSELSWKTFCQSLIKS